MNRANKILILLLSFILLFTITACDLNNQKQETAKPEDSSQNQKITKPIKQEIPDYVLTKEVFKDETGEVYGTVKYDYDDKGNLLQVDYINKQGEVIERKKYKYNQYGLKTKRIVTKLVENADDYGWRNTSRDKLELDKERVVMDAMSTYTEGVADYEYNSNGQLTYYEERNKEGEKVRWIKVKYYENGNQKFRQEWRKTDYEEKKYFNQQGELKREVTEDGEYVKEKKRFYDNSGNCVKEIKTKKKRNKPDNIVAKTTYKNKYNNQGKKSKQIVRDIFLGVKTNLYRKYKYDKKGNLKKVITKNKQGDIEEIRRYKYDNLGNRVLLILDDKNSNTAGFKTETSYKYDKAGNIISAISKDSEGEVEKNKDYYYKKLK